MPPKPIIPPPQDRHWRAFQTCIEMFVDRKYVVPQHYVDMAEKDFTQAHVASNPIVLEGVRDKERIVALFDIESESKTGVKTLRDLSAFMEKESVREAIIVSERGANSMLLKELNQLNDRGYFVQFFCFIELYRNVSRHKLVPPHTGLTAEEANDVCTRLKVQLNQFPRLLLIDPQVRYHGFRKDRMVKIERNLGGMIHPHTVFRVVH